MKHVLIYGASGHAKVVLDILHRCRRAVVGFVDDDPGLWGKTFQAQRVLGGFELFSQKEYQTYELLLAIGDNVMRKRLAVRLSPMQIKFASVIHPSAALASNVSIATGTVIMAHVAVNPETTVGSQVILNTGCTVDHDCIIADFVHISPGAHLAGNVTVGEGAHLGVGVNVIPGISIGAGTVVGAGATVISDLPDFVTAVGVPAQIIKTAPAAKTEKKA